MSIAFCVEDYTSPTTLARSARGAERIPSLAVRASVAWFRPRAVGRVQYGYSIREGRILAVIEIVSPGNKGSSGTLHRFVRKTGDFLSKCIHVLVVDLFPPTPRDPHGIHQAIWDDIAGRPFELPPGKDRTLASSEAINEMEVTAYIEPLAVGDALPDMPLFLTRDLIQNLHVQVPLESTYQATWVAATGEFRRAVETGEMPGAGAELSKERKPIRRPGKAIVRQLNHSANPKKFTPPNVRLISPSVRALASSVMGPSSR